MKLGRIFENPASPNYYAQWKPEKVVVQPMGVDLANEPEPLAHFIKVYLETFADQGFDRIRLTDAELADRYDEFFATAYAEEHAIEDCTEVILDKDLMLFMRSVARMDAGVARYARFVLADLFFHASMIVVREDRSQANHYQRYTIECLHRAALLELTQSWCQNVGNDNPVVPVSIEHLFSEEYHDPDVGPGQRMLLVSLAHLRPELRKAICADPAFRKVYAHPAETIFDWMLACSGTEEQFYLNTCDGASMDQYVLAQSGTIHVALEIARQTTATIVRNLRNAAVPDGDRQYVAKRVDVASTEFDKIAHRVGAASNDAKVLRPTLRDLTLDWGRQMQKLLAAFNVNAPATLTNKVIDEQWGLSAAVMFFPVLAQGLAPGRRMKGRMTGIDGKAFANEAGSRFFVSGLAISNADYDPDKSHSADALWYNAFSIGGMGIATSGHILFAKAAYDKDQHRVFLVSDPKVRSYAVKSLVEFPVWLRKEKIESVRIGSPAFCGAPRMKPVVLIERGNAKWQSDAPEQCPGCQAKFSVFTRMHHCRLCGLVFCDKCCPKREGKIPTLKSDDKTRACAGCWGKVLEM